MMKKLLSIALTLALALSGLGLAAAVMLKRRFQ